LSIPASAANLNKRISLIVHTSKLENFRGGRSTNLPIGIAKAHEEDHV
jgi:hypothetical protein